MARNAFFLPSSMRSTYAPTPRATTPAGSYGMTRSYGAPIGGGRAEGMGMFTISRKTFQNIEEFIADNERSIEKAQIGIDLLTRLIALSVKGFAQGRAAGPVAPRHRSVPAMANRIPVQRISGAYFAGWKHRKLGMAHWLVYNEAREAYLIEYGVFQRVRRPVLKMSMIDTLRFLQTTRTGERFLEGVLAPRRNAKGQFQSFNTRIQGTATLGGLAGPQGPLP
jgi:hypothetical protein